MATQLHSEKKIEDSYALLRGAMTTYEQKARALYRTRGLTSNGANLSMIRTSRHQYIEARDALFLLIAQHDELRGIE